MEVVDPYDMKGFEKTVRKHLGIEGLSVIVARQRCVLLDRKKPKEMKSSIDQEKCEKCGLCIKFGCPAIELKDGDYSINEPAVQRLRGMCGYMPQRCHYMQEFIIKYF